MTTTQTSHPTCTYDSGSMYDCQPLCTAPATVRITERASGGYGPFVYNVCKRHHLAMLGRIFPVPYDEATI